MPTPTARALVVEDDRSWQQILAELLNDAGLVVDIADSLATTTALLRAASHRIAVVDLSLGGSDHRNQDGLRILEAVRKLDPGCQAILLTGFATVELAVSALKEYGAHTCLRKERFRRSEFRQLIQEVLAAAPAQIGGPEASGFDSNAASSPAPGIIESAPKAPVLVVEDDAGWQSILEELLTDAGHEVRLCRSYAEALGFLRREHPALAVIDLSLASSLQAGVNADGYRLLAAARERRIPAIVVSGVASPNDAARAYDEYDVFAFLEKQAFDRKAFVRTVAEALATAGGNPVLAGLTDREREVIELLVKGLTNNQIADLLVISPNTVKRHLKAIFAKLDVNTRSAAVAKAMGEG